MALFLHRRKVAERELAKKEQPKVEPKKEEKKEGSGITKEDVAALPFFKLKSLAKSNGIDVKDKKADELRAALIEKLGL